MVPQEDASFNQIRDLVSVLHLDPRQAERIGVSMESGRPGGPAMIEAVGLGMRYPTGKVALEGASLSVAPGEMVVVLGHNGSGKSTMLRCIAGMLRPTAGTVAVDGQR